MGLVKQGIPRNIVRELAGLSGASVFIETGTYHGATARWAASVFEQVHTIEMAQGLYNQARIALADLQGVCPHFGDSAEILPRLMSQLGEDRALLWLDGHWSGGETAGEDRECPLMAELECLVDRPQDIILVDDARFFLCAPPKPHQPEQWPTIADIVRVFDGERHQRFFQVIDDVIFIVPAESALTAALVRHAQTPAETPKTPTATRSRIWFWRKG